MMSRTQLSHFFSHAVTILLVLTISVAVFGVLGRWWWLFEVLSHFYHLYFAAFLGITLIYLFQKKYTYAAVAGIAALLSGYMVWSVYIPTASAYATGQNAQPLRVMLFNTNYYTGDSRKTADSILHHDPDVVVLVEPAEQFLTSVTSALDADYPHHQLITGYRSFNIAFYSRYPLSTPELFAPEGTTMHGARTTVTVGDTTVAVYGVHPIPPYDKTLAAQRQRYYDLLAQRIQRDTLPVIVAGDFNSTPWSPLFRDLLTQAGVQDSRKGHGVHSSWPTFVPQVLRIPIDHMLISPDIGVTDRFIGASAGSDHLPVIVDLVLPR